MIQVIHRRVAEWEVLRVTHYKHAGGEQVSEYETLGWVVLEDRLYWVERARWDACGEASRLREGRGHLLMRAAVATLSAERLRS